MKKTPRIFHFVFGLRPQTEPFHLMHYLCIASCLHINKPDAVLFHYQHMPWGPWWELIAPSIQLHKIEPDKFISSFLYNDPAIGQYRYAHLSDIARLEILIKYGGIYADIDTLFINKLPNHFFEYEFVMGMEKVDWTTIAAQTAGGSLCNAWMMGEPNSDFAKLLLARTYESFDGTWSAHSTFLPYRLSREHPDWIHVEPQRSFFFYDWTGKGIRGIFEESLPNMDNVYSIHLWSHMWWDRKRIDTSYFHAVRLTPEYVRFSKSAYAELARPFLPESITYSRLRFELQKINIVWENGEFASRKYLEKIYRWGKNILRESAQTAKIEEKSPVKKQTKISVKDMKTIKYIGFNDSTGYSIAARTMVSALRKENATVHWVPVVWGSSAYNPHSVKQIREGYRNVIIHTVPEYYPYWLNFEQEEKTKSKKIWGYTAWETDKIPSHWAKLLNIMDGIFVPCHWNKEVFRKCGIQTRIEVLPHISQFHGQVPEVSPSPKLNKLIDRMGTRFVFYNIGVWSDRKAPWLLIEAFLSEFSPHEPVTLVVKTGEYDFSKYKRKWYKPWQLTPHKTVSTFKIITKFRTNGPEIIHLDEEFSDTDIAWLHKRGDCFVSLARGEGWGMASYEAAWCGKPIIITGFGGVLDYLPENISYHVNYRLMPVHLEADKQSYTPDQLWADPDLAHARQLMRQVFEDQKGAAEKGLQLRNYVNRNFNSALIARKCLDALEAE